MLRSLLKILAALAGLSALAASAAAFDIGTVAPGVYVHRGLQQDATAANGGDIANIGFIVGSRCVAVIDSGGTRTIGRALRAAIRSRSDRPVCYLIHTHVHPDHSLGDRAFDDDPGTVFVAHAEYPAALAARQDGYAARLRQILGNAAEGSTSVVPTRLISGRETLDLGDRQLTVQAWPTAHTNHDLSVFDEQTRTLWTGDLLFVERIPVIDGKAGGWLQVMASLRALKPAHLVPGHGPVDRTTDAAFGAQQEYLEQLVSSVRAALKAGTTLAATVDSLGRQHLGGWLLSEDYHRRNITAVYTELEWED